MMVTDSQRLLCSCGSKQWIEERIIEVREPSADSRLSTVPASQVGFRLRCASCGRFSDPVNP